MSGLSGITITKYTPTLATEWDRFVEESRNGTFLHKRGYMDYHANRFNDHSLMFYNNGKLIATLPAHIKENSLCSHNGITYGGLILGEECTTETTLEIFNTLRSYLRANTATTEIIYRPTPHIYHRCPCEEDIYALFRNGAVLTECKASSAIELCNPIKPKGRRRLTAAMKSRLHIKEENDYTSFWTILPSCTRTFIPTNVKIWTREKSTNCIKNLFIKSKDFIISTTQNIIKNTKAAFYVVRTTCTAKIWIGSQNTRSMTRSFNFWNNNDI